MSAPSEAMIGRIAERFKALGDETRIRILDELQAGPAPVGVLAAALGVGQASMSKHIDRLAQVGIVARQREGNHTIISIQDAAIYDLCEQVCAGVQRHLDDQLRSLEA
jgi:DNA-binding transcriptional ArsR family regulator